MEDIEVIKQKLLDAFKPHKATRLIGFWLYVQRFGTDDAKATFGKDSYYRSKADLKTLGISLIEPPKLIDAKDRFIKSFSFVVPSEYAANTVDDLRTSGNLLNLIKKTDLTAGDN